MHNGTVRTHRASKLNLFKILDFIFPFFFFFFFSFFFVFFPVIIFFLWRHVNLKHFQIYAYHAIKFTVRRAFRQFYNYSRRDDALAHG